VFLEGDKLVAEVKHRAWVLTHQPAKPRTPERSATTSSDTATGAGNGVALRRHRRRRGRASEARAESVDVAPQHGGCQQNRFSVTAVTPTAEMPWHHTLQ
jgi:hypothetical protein